MNPAPMVGAYLLVALTTGSIIAMLLRRAMLGALLGAITTMIGAALLSGRLPGRYGLYAREVIVEPFYISMIVAHPFEAVSTLVFHIGAPVALMWAATRLLRRLRQA